VHDALGLKVPLAAPWVNATVPVGVVEPEADASVTVAVHFVATPRATVDGAQDIMVVVECEVGCDILTVALPALTAWTVASPR